MIDAEHAITLGHPSYVWREGQQRRLEMVRRYVPLEGARILDVGCGLGLYVRAMSAYSSDVHGVDVDPERVAQASALLPNIREALAEALPYPDDTFDLVFSNEVLEHVASDRVAVREAWRVLKPGGRLAAFVPNRWYPFETHGVYWRGRYHYGNIPLVNYLPNTLRQRLAPHVRAYTWRDLRRLFDDLPGRIVSHERIFAGYDNIVARHPALGRALRAISYTLEHTPLQVLGLSHLIIFEKQELAGGREEHAR